MKSLIFKRLMTIAAPLLTWAIAVPVQASTALPMTISTGEGMFSLVAPDTNTTRPAYGGKLRVYDVHVAKMVEITHLMCSTGRLSPGTTWSYSAGNGSINMGNFNISCQLASDLASAYGLGNPEQTPIYISAEEAGGSTKQFSVPILNITGGKINRWMNFTRNFKPTR